MDRNVTFSKKNKYKYTQNDFKLIGLKLKNNKVWLYNIYEFFKLLSMAF